MTNETQTPASPAAIVFTVKEGDIVTGTVARIKAHPPKGLLIRLPNDPMAFLPNGCVAGKNEAEKAARRAHLIANPGTEVAVAVMSDPFVDNGKPKIKVSEQRAVIAADKVARDARAQEQTAALEAAIASLQIGSVVTGTVKSPAQKKSTFNEGDMYVYGAFIQVAPGITGLLHVKQIDQGDRGLKAIIAAGKVDVVIVSARIENGQPRVELSQKSVGEIEIQAWAQSMSGRTVRGKVAKTGEVVGDLHGRIIELESGDKVFLADDDANVKQESTLARGVPTRVIMTGEIVEGMVRVTRRGV